MAFNAEAAGSGFPATLGNISEMRGNIRKAVGPNLEIAMRQSRRHRFG
jgi:hypothetical protein